MSLAQWQDGGNPLDAERLRDAWGDVDGSGRWHEPQLGVPAAVTGTRFRVLHAAQVVTVVVAESFMATSNSLV